jgi:hypothetical protein
MERANKFRWAGLLALMISIAIVFGLVKS